MQVVMLRQQTQHSRGHSGCEEGPGLRACQLCQRMWWWAALAQRGLSRRLTPAAPRAALGLPLQPNDLPASVDYVQLLDALDRGFGAEAYVTCTRWGRGGVWACLLVWASCLQLLFATKLGIAGVPCRGPGPR